jgi:hypothetical protein
VFVGIKVSFWDLIIPIGIVDKIFVLLDAKNIPKK